VQPWDRQSDPRNLDFNHAPVCIQLWGLPPHCKTKQLGISIGELLGKVEVADLYEYPGKKVIVKIKVFINVYQPITTGILIGNQRDGTHWIDFRYENLPQVCFKHGLLGHSDKLCMNEAINMENQTPIGPWIRSNQYGRRLVDEKDKRYHSNPSQGSNYGQYNPPIPATMLEQMAAMKIKEENEAAEQNQSEDHHQNSPQKSRFRRQTPKTGQVNPAESMVLAHIEEHHMTTKRPRQEEASKEAKDIIMAGPAQQASQKP
jgi:hypothetical protein